MAIMTGKQVLHFCQQPEPRFRALVHICLILLLAGSLAQLTWHLLPVPELTPLLPERGQGKVPVTNVGTGSLVQQIPSWHLFGEPSRVVEQAPVELPETNLKLTLRGLIASSLPAEAAAIIADSSNNENFYKIGDKLPGNAELSEIHADRVVIQRGGRYETLKLPKEALDLGTDSAPQSIVSRQAASSPQDYSLAEYRDTLLSNPQQVADLIRIQPASQNGRFIGYTLLPGRDAGFLAKYGLQPGDVVTSVNGVQLDSPTKGFGLMKDLSSADTLNLTVQRNGVAQQFTLPVN